MLPDRIHTGIRNITIPNPAVLHRNDRTGRTFQGPASRYNFEKQTENYLRLHEVLLASGKEFDMVAAAHYRGDLHTNHRFVVTTKDGSLLWHKYVGFAAQSGQNHVFVGRRRIKLSYFLHQQPHQQAALLSGNEAVILSVFTGPQLAFLDETDTLWN